MTDEQLQAELGRLHGGDRAAFEKIYTELKTPLFTIILRVTRDNELSEDLLQELFIKLYQSPPKSPIKKPRAYIFRMARNLAVDGMRKRHQFASLDDEENTMCSPQEDIAGRMDIENALGTLPTAECQIVSLRINGELKFQEIADVMGVPLGTVLWRYQRALGRLRSILDGGTI